MEDGRLKALILQYQCEIDVTLLKWDSFAIATAKASERRAGKLLALLRARSKPQEAAEQ